MAHVVLKTRVNGRRVDVGCYGTASDWVCRFTYPGAQPNGRIGDDYWPPPDLGFVWLRDAGGMWVASGMVHRSVFSDPDKLDALLVRISRGAIGRDDQLASCVEFVTTAETVAFDGELGEQRGPGSWAHVRWQRKNGG
jgi:hypothetical protein